MRKIIGLIIILLLAHSAYASHISGGELYYTYLGKSASDPSKLSYRITLLLYKDTTVTGTMVANLQSSYNVSIYRGDNNGLVGNFVVSRSNYEYMKLSTYNPCLSNKPRIEFAVATYQTTVDLAPLAEGYYVSHSQCCRVTAMLNINSNLVGVTYWVKIPGSNDNPFAPDNSSAFFLKKDTILVCRNSPVQLDFSAQDPDIGDSLVYSLSPGYLGAGPPPNQLPAQSELPPYNQVTYLPGFTFSQPFGNNSVKINPVTGLVTGTSPAVTGIYLVAVLVQEFRSGKKISEHRKEFQINVQDCSITAATLQPAYINCNNYSLYFENESASPVTSYLWDFGEKNVSNTTSTQPTPTHQYADTGTYTLKLKVTNATGCQDSTSSTVKIYPGFTAGFTIQGSCYLNPYQFHDASVTKYGTVNSWRWNFGDSTTLADTAQSKDSAWRYPSPATVKVQLITTNSKGCIDTATKTLTIVDRPAISLAFRDTLICSIDTLPLRASINSGSAITWVPDNTANRQRILNANTANPLVYPKDTTRYFVTVTDNGCVSYDTVRVNVLQFISVQLNPDTSICQTDSIVLNPTSYALSYRWSPATGLSNVNVKYPKAAPLTTTTYQVTANLGKCQANAQTLIRVSPYPKANITNQDTTICFGSRVALHATYTANSFRWTPTSSLIYSNTLNPVAGPTRTTSYIFIAYDTLPGCPRPVSDTITITVIPPFTVFAGRDTAVTANQPMQLNASSDNGTSFAWRPADWLNNPAIQNPIATIPPTLDSIRYIVRATDENGCYADDDLVVRVYKTAPDIWVPSAFTPNSDGKNDVVKPVTVGITQLFYFRIYNRWGQLLFVTSETGKGWDGTYSGVKQASGTYVFEAAGVDFMGKPVYKKGTIVLIR